MSLLAEGESFFVAPLHESENEPPEGKFATHVWGPRQERHELRRRIARLEYWLFGLTLCFVSAIVVIAYRW